MGTRTPLITVDSVPDEVDDEGSGEPPHPLDRVWFHPSELSGFIAAAPSRLGGREWGLAGVAALLGAVLTASVLAIAGAFDGGTETATLPRLTIVGGDTAEVSQIVERAAPSVVTVQGQTAFGDVTGSGVSIGRSQVLTSASLLTGAAPTVTVATPDGRALRATIAGLDPDLPDAGRQDAVYDAFFRRVQALLPEVNPVTRTVKARIELAHGFTLTAPDTEIPSGCRSPASGRPG